jgi:hypothetical protein
MKIRNFGLKPIKIGLIDGFIDETFRIIDWKIVESLEIHRVIQVPILPWSEMLALKKISIIEERNFQDDSLGSLIANFPPKLISFSLRCQRPSHPLLSKALRNPLLELGLSIRDKSWLPSQEILFAIRECHTLASLDFGDYISDAITTIFPYLPNLRVVGVGAIDGFDESTFNDIEEISTIDVSAKTATEFLAKHPNLRKLSLFKLEADKNDEIFELLAASSKLDNLSIFSMCIPQRNRFEDLLKEFLLLSDRVKVEGPVKVSAYPDLPRAVRLDDNRPYFAYRSDGYVFHRVAANSYGN